MKTALCWQFLSLPNLKSHRHAHTLPFDLVIETRKAYSPSSIPETSPIGSSNSISCCEASPFSDAHKLFDELPHRDVVSATSLISRLGRNHRHREAIAVFSRMLESNIRPNEYSFGTVIHSSTALKDISLGKQLHACSIKTGLLPNVFVGSAVLNLYAKLSVIEEAQRTFEDTHNPNVVSYTTLICGYLKKERFDEAMRIFRTMPERNVVSWNAVIGGYSQTGHNEEAVKLFVEMMREGLAPTQSTFPCVFSAAANIAVLGIGKSIHACAVKSLGNLGGFVGNSLVSFYAKCGNMEDCLLVFKKLPERSVVSWNALICGYSQNGRAKEAIDLYHQMQTTGLQPNSVTLLGLLLACSYVGLVNEGFSYFNQAKLKNPSMLEPEHYACMVDLLSRSGRFEEAEKFISELPFDPGIGFWKALLGGCQIHSSMVLGKFAAKKILALDPGDVSSYVMMSNAHCAAGRWGSASTTRHEMRDKGMRTVPGCSWIEMKSKLHVFVTQDKTHEQRDKIYMILRVLLDHIMSSKSHENYFLIES
ncbi:hypothetical protein RJ640_024194 [Escallonia rubra]|uniref:Pentatricopeptide repeat-containing protein n=1 Tax=Escallonia rubra TaxID=112253 RepID=A0AA88UAQ0_9ASTE|nr:hypothetical protein RJ640_024194 [Escallonia rubra]